LEYAEIGDELGKAIFLAETVYFCFHKMLNCKVNHFSVFYQ